MEGYFDTSYGRERAPRRSLIGRMAAGVLTVLTAAVAATLLLTYAAPYVNPASVWLFPVLGLIAPATYLAAVLLTLYWVVRWRPRRALAMLLITGCGLFGVSLFYKPELRRRYAETETKERGTLLFMTYNVRNFADDAGRNAAGKVLRFVQETAPDVVCFQEYSPSLAEKSAEYRAFAQTYPHRAGGRGAEFEPMVLFSKHPVAGWGATRDGLPEDGIRESLWADIRIKDDTVRVFNNHLHSTAIKAEDNEFITKHRYISDSAREDKIRSIVHRFRDNSILRAEQADSIAKAVAATSLARIVCGDFNDTPMSYVYRTMARGLDDAFSSCGRGYSHTFRGFFNALRIDYVLVSDEFEPLTYEVPDVEFSDHLPVVVRMRYRYRH